MVDKFGAIIKFVDSKTKLQIDQVCYYVMIPAVRALWQTYMPCVCV